jgi:hypothetical protein
MEDELSGTKRMSTKLPDSPARVTLSRRKGWRMPPNTVKVCRPGKWGNPFVVGKDGDAQQCVDLYECLTAEWRTEQAESLNELSGKNLACWCKPGTPCHADVLLSLANRKTTP